ncbi:hypothetical protein [Paraburkholderia unamae]|uniref:Uncharacterized protein n=1 Tax=Paraburkholderia unamae TaxID=219649 RepID=A0ACC6RW84_9BURK
MSQEPDALLREAFEALDGLGHARDLRDRIGQYLAARRAVDTSKVATDLLSVNSGASGYAVDQAVQRVKDIGKS